MPSKVAMNTINASTIDILNTIRANASYAYQSQVPQIATANEIPAVGEKIYGYPALANEFIAALLNQIALVEIRSKNFYNKYQDLKKGKLEYGELVEEVFVNIAKAREFSAEKAEARELKRTLPDVRTAFHAKNWSVQYPVTIQDVELQKAFSSENGVQDMIAKIVDSVYNANEYDEYLLFKYLLIKAIAHGKMYPVAVGAAMTDAAVKFRGSSNQLTFMDTRFNESGVHTFTDKEDQYIFMDAEFNAAYDVNVLASAFNMDKADFEGRLKLIDSFTTFDNERFDAIRAGSDQIEEVTAAELALMTDVKAVLVDREWFQVWDNVTRFTEKYVASGMYWNYFLNVQKTVSSSPFSNAVVFVASGASIADPASVTFTVSDIASDRRAQIFTLELSETETLEPQSYNFIQDETATAAGIAVHKYGAVIMPKGTGAAASYIPKLAIGSSTYTAGTALAPASTAIGDSITFTKDS